MATSFLNPRKQKLHALEYLPARPCAVLFFHHGIGEYAQRYDPVFQSLAGKGIAVFTYDAAGHGESEPHEAGSRAMVWSWKDLVTDMFAFRDFILAKHPALAPLPAFIGGHSLGGLVATHVALESQSSWHGLIIHSPAIDMEWSLALRLQVPVSGLLSALVPGLRMVPAVRPEEMSQDPEVVAQFIADPLIYKGPLPIRTGSEVLRAFTALSKRYGELTLPIYAVHGTLDKCTSLSATKKLVALSNSSDKTFREVEGGYHELLHGPERQECTDRMAQWILEHVPVRSAL